MTEKYDTFALDKLNDYLAAVLDNIENLKCFAPNHKQCCLVDKGISHVDDIGSVISMVTELNIDNVLINHFENLTVNQFIVVLKKSLEGSYECSIGYSLDQIQLLLIPNIFIT